MCCFIVVNKERHCKKLFLDNICYFEIKAGLKDDLGTMERAMGYANYFASEAQRYKAAAEESRRLAENFLHAQTKSEQHPLEDF